MFDSGTILSYGTKWHHINNQAYEKFLGMKIDNKCKHLLSFPRVSLWALYNNGTITVVTFCISLSPVYYWTVFKNSILCDTPKQESTQPHTALLTLEFCPHFLVYHGTHTTPNLSSFWWPVFNMSYINLGQLAGERGQFSLCGGL
jgi:hypothetical protein